MGNSLPRRFQRSVRALMVGLDAAGKTSILYHWKLGEVVTTIPTIGFNVETVQCRNLGVICWDVGGKDKIRPLWRHYYQGTDVVIFVIDSNDRDRAEDARAELQRFLNEDELLNAFLLVLANKQDYPNAMTVNEVTSVLGLHQIRGRHWHIQGTSIVTQEGLEEGLESIVSAMTEPGIRREPPPDPSDLAVFLHVDSIDEGVIQFDITCTNVTGDQLATIQVYDATSQSVADIRLELASALNREGHTLRLVSACGQTLSMIEDTKSIRDALCSQSEELGDRRIRCTLDRCVVS